MNAIIAYELGKLKSSYRDVFSRLQRLSKNPDVCDLVFRLLTSRVLHEACGASDCNGIAVGYDLDDPLDRMHFVGWFVGHEILDDGMPVKAWHKWCDRFVSCDRDDIKAQPFIHHTVDQVTEGYEVVGVDIVNDILDWHEMLRGRRSVLLGRTEVDRPVYGLMGDLVDELGA